MQKVEIDIETLRGIFLILCGVSYNHSGAEVINENTIALMEKSHKEIIELGKNLGFDNRGYDIKKERLLIEMSGKKQLELWEGVYFKGSSYEMDKETYTSVDIIDTSDPSVGESWDYIVQRKSDGLYYKFSVCDANHNDGYVCKRKGLEQVFQTTKNTYE